MKITTGELARLKVGDKVWFAEEKLGYTVQACDGRYFVCTKPFNPRNTVLYTIIDLPANIRGAEDLIFGMGAETREQCEEMLGRLRAGDSGVSHRNVVALHAIRTKKGCPAVPA